jgi:hypothetical protein
VGCGIASFLLASRRWSEVYVKKRLAGIMAKTRQLAHFLYASFALRWHIQTLSMPKEAQSC